MLKTNAATKPRPAPHPPPSGTESTLNKGTVDKAVRLFQDKVLSVVPSATQSSRVYCWSRLCHGDVACKIAISTYLWVWLSIGTTVVGRSLSTRVWR